MRTGGRDRVESSVVKWRNSKGNITKLEMANDSKPQKSTYKLRVYLASAHVAQDTVLTIPAHVDAHLTKLSRHTILLLACERILHQNESC